MKRGRWFSFCFFIASWTVGNLQATTVSTLYGISRQVNVNAAGQNIVGDAANEPSMCISPTNANYIAIGWRQFDTVTFRSDPVLATDGNGVFYYLGISNSSTFSCDLMRSTNSGATWQPVGPALGGDKEWMAIDTTSGPGHGNIYQVWSPFFNVYNNDPNHLFTRSTDGGLTWSTAIGVPHAPFFGTMDVGSTGAGTPVTTGILAPKPPLMHQKMFDDRP